MDPVTIALAATSILVSLHKAYLHYEKGHKKEIGGSIKRLIEASMQLDKQLIVAEDIRIRSRTSIREHSDQFAVNRQNLMSAERKGWNLQAELAQNVSAKHLKPNKAQDDVPLDKMTKPLMKWSRLEAFITDLQDTAAILGARCEKITNDDKIQLQGKKPERQGQHTHQWPLPAGSRARSGAGPEPQGPVEDGDQVPGAGDLDFSESLLGQVDATVEGWGGLTEQVVDLVGDVQELVDVETLGEVLGSLEFVG